MVMMFFIQASAPARILALFCCLLPSVAAAQAVDGARNSAIEMVDDAEKADSASAAISKMKSILKRTLGHLSEAREKGDVVKNNCVHSKLAAIKGLLRIGEGAFVGLEEALALGDKEASAHEYEKVAIGLQKSEQLGAESDECVGEHAVYAGKTVVELEEPDVSEELFDNLTITSFSDAMMSRPPSASPYI